MNCNIWYHSSSPWRQPIGADTQIITDPAYYIDGNMSKGMKAFWDDRNNRFFELTSDTSQYTYPIHYVNNSMPLVEVVFMGVLSEVKDEDNDGDEDKTIRHRWGTARYKTHLDVSARYEIPSGSDAQFIFINTDTGKEFAVWQAEDVNGNGIWEPWLGERVMNGYSYNIGWTGYPPCNPNNGLEQFLSRGAGVPYGVGLIRRCEIERGRIEHAIAFAHQKNHDTSFVFPATKTDGHKFGNDGPLGDTIAEGQLVQLDPNISETTMRSWGLSDAGVIIAKALQEYGMRSIDNSGSFKLIGEHESTANWTAITESQRVVRNTVSKIPVQHFRPIENQYPFNTQISSLHEYKPDETDAPADDMSKKIAELEAKILQLKQNSAITEERIIVLETKLERVRKGLE